MYRFAGSIELGNSYPIASNSACVETAELVGNTVTTSSFAGSKVETDPSSTPRQLIRKEMINMIMPIGNFFIFYITLAAQRWASAVTAGRAGEEGEPERLLAGHAFPERRKPLSAASRGWVALSL